MANFANTPAGFATAEIWAVAKMADGTWSNAHAGHDNAGNTVCRFQRFMAFTSAGTRDDGEWVESRVDNAT